MLGIAPPPKLTKSQALYKFLDLANFRGCQFPHGGDLIKLGGGGKQKKITLYVIY